MAYDLIKRKIDDTAAKLMTSLTEKLCDLGLAWRIDTGYMTLSADGDYATIHFHTPDTHRTFFTFAQIDKSGNELVSSIIRGGTYAGGAESEAFNYNEDDPIESSCALTDIKVGTSIDVTPTTITGGTERFFNLAPGGSNPSSSPGGSSSSQGVVILKRESDYTVKFLAKGALTFAAHITLALYLIRMQ